VQGGGPPGHASAAPVQVGRGRQQARDALRRGRRGGAAGQARAAGAAREAGPAVRVQVRQQRPGGSLRLQRVRARAERQRARRAVLLRGRLRPGRARGRAVLTGLPALLPSSGAGGSRHSALLLGSAAELRNPGVHGVHGVHVLAGALSGRPSRQAAHRSWSARFWHTAAKARTACGALRWPCISCATTSPNASSSGCVALPVAHPHHVTTSPRGLLTVASSGLPGPPGTPPAQLAAP